MFDFTRPLLASVTVMLWLAPAVCWGQAISADVQRNGQRFDIEFSVEVDEPAARVFELLTDYRNLEQISPSTSFSGWVTQDVLRVEIRACVLVFCKTMTKLTQVAPSGDRAVDYSGVGVAGSFKSSFRNSIERLSVSQRFQGERALVEYSAMLETAFTVPAIVRGWMVRYVLLRDLRMTLAAVEAMIAQEKTPLNAGTSSSSDLTKSR